MPPRDSLKKIIAQNLSLEVAVAVPEIQLYRAHPRSGLSRLVGEDGPPPYWAYGWAGGTVLARYILDYPEIVAGRRVLDYGCGSGLVAIAAAKAGAHHVVAVDIDPHAVVAARLNAEANGVAVEAVEILPELSKIDVVLAGDVVYAEAVATETVTFLDACVGAGLEVLLGDPGRAFLPRQRLIQVAGYDVPDFGDAAPKAAVVYRFR